MILYFSATGNTKLIAEALAHQLGDECISLLNRIRMGDYSPIRSELPFVICAPIYVSELATFFSEYLRKVPLAGNGDVYGIFTNGMPYRRDRLDACRRIVSLTASIAVVYNENHNSSTDARGT